ncbi:MAG: transcription antitermination factor NusB [Treponemataceae bacterium]|nr:transcription antitermination factor NusB [Treponemataceae bacterium]
MSRRIGRILAFQALYLWDVGGVPAEDLLSFSWLERDCADFADDARNSAGGIEPPAAPEIVGDAAALDASVADNGVKYCLIDNLLAVFEKLPSEKKEEVFAFARLLEQGTLEHINEVDVLIKTHLSARWSFRRINKVALAVIRMSVYSLLYQKELSASVVIDEAVEIVKDYGSDDSHKFTNAILDKISKDIVQS